MPCVQAKARREREEFIRNNRRDVDPYKGLDDPFEILKVMLHPQKPDPLVRLLPCPRAAEDLYAELDAKQTAALLQHATSLPKRRRFEQAEDIARCLTAFTEADISPLLRAFVSAGHFYPGFIFLRATPDIRDLLIERLARVHKERNRQIIRNHLLSALAWIGDDCVVDLFGQWHISPPSWAKTLHVPPDKYSEEAGWQLSTDLCRRDLYHRECYPLRRTDAGEPISPAVAVTERQDRCPWCKRPLSNLLELDCRSGQLAFLACPNGRLTVPICESCGCFGVLFGELGEQGSTWSAHNTKPDYLPDEGDDGEGVPRRRLSMVRVPRSPWHAADQFLPTTFSQIGGHPAWIQDALYPECPKCHQTMIFVGQVACEDIDEYMEGIYYAFLCSKCHATASCYQQT
jgi:hypothetical protein